MKAGVAAGLLAGAALLASVLSSVFYVLPESHQALILRFGRPVRLETGAGLRFKLPFVDQADIIDTRVLSLVPAPEEIILGDQKRVQAGVYAEFVIDDPLRFVQAVATLDAARDQLTHLLRSAVRRVLGQVRLADLLTTKRANFSAAIRDDTAANARPLGIRIIDVQIKNVDLPPATSQAIYDRMTSERQREAKQLRAQGYEWAQQIMAQADSDRTRLLAEAQEQAQIARGEGDAAASQLFAEAFKNNADFYRFYRAVQSYGGALAGSQPLLVLSPDSDAMRYFNKMDGGKSDNHNNARPVAR